MYLKGGAYCLNGDNTSSVTNENEDETEDAQMAVETMDPLRLNAEHGTIMIIQDEQMEDNSNTLTVTTPSVGPTVVMAGSEVMFHRSPCQSRLLQYDMSAFNVFKVQFFDDKITLQNKILELEQQNQQLRLENKRLERQYEKEIELLKSKVILCYN